MKILGALNEAAPTTVASATTTDIGAATSNTVSISTIGNNITSFGTAASGTVRRLVFTGGLTITHNATSLILPTGASITTAAGDTAEFVSLGSGNWRCLWYQRATGLALVGSPDATKLPLAGGTLTGALNENTIATLASAATTAIGTGAAANTISITGTTTITSFGTTTSGRVRRLVFAGVLTLTHNATSLILPGAANIVTAAGDTAEFVALGSGNWRCLWYTRADGTSLVSASLLLAGGRMTGAIEYAGYGTLTAADNLGIAAVNANTVRIDYSGGALSINAFGTGTAGTRRILFFNNTQPFTLIHDPSLTILPGNANTVPAQGDFAEFQCEGGATWRCMWYQRRNVVGATALTSGASIAVDASLSNKFKLLLATNATLANPTNLSDGMEFKLRIKQDATGSRTLAYGTKYKFPSGASKVLSTAANAVDLLTCYYDSTDDILVCSLAKGFA